MGIFDWLRRKQKQPASEESRVAVAKKTRKHSSVPELKEAGDVAGLIGALSSDAFSWRKEAAEALGNIGNQRALTLLGSRNTAPKCSSSL